MLETLEMGLKELGELDPNELTDEELAELVVKLSTFRSVYEANEARIDRAFDTRRVWAGAGARTARPRRAHRTGEPAQAGGARLWLGRHMIDLPVAAEAWLAGEITAAHLRVLADARNPRTADLLARDEAMLVHNARTMSFSGFALTVAYWSALADPDGADDDSMRKQAKRKVSLDETIAGMYSGHLFLDPVSGIIVYDELQRIYDQLFKADWAEAKARLGRDPVPAELCRTPDQRRADALVEMARRSAAMPPGSKMPKPLFTVVVGSDRLSRLFQLATG